MRRNVPVANATRLVRQPDGRVAMRYRERDVVIWGQSGQIILRAPIRTAYGYRAMVERMRCALPFDWSIIRGVNRRYRLMYRDAYPITLSGTITLVADGVDADGSFMSRRELDEEVATRTNTEYVPEPTLSVCECARSGRALANDDVVHGEYLCYQPNTPEQDEEAWERAQVWLAPALAEYRANLTVPEVEPRCDVCSCTQNVYGDDWNSETGNHVACETFRERHGT